QDAGPDTHGIHTHGDGLIHIHPFDSTVTKGKATLRAFLDDVGATVTSDAVRLPGEVVPFSGTCEGKPAHLVVKRWTSSSDAAPRTTRVSRSSDLLDQYLGPDGSVLAIALVADQASVPLPRSSAQLGDPVDATPTPTSVPGSVRSPAPGVRP